MFGQVLGAAFGAAALSGVVTSWSDAFENYSTGGLLGAILEPFGGFGKFLLVILGLGMICKSLSFIRFFYGCVGKQSNFLSNTQSTSR